TAVDSDGTKVDQLQRGRRRLQQQLGQAAALLGAGAAVLLVLALRSRQRPLCWWLAWPLLLLNGAELADHGHRLNRGRADAIPLDTTVHAFLRRERERSAAQGGFMVARANPGGGDAMHLPPGTLAQDHIRDLDFYSFVDRYSSEPLRALYGEG